MRLFDEDKKKIRTALIDYSLYEREIDKGDRLEIEQFLQGTIRLDDLSESEKTILWDAIGLMSSRFGEVAALYKDLTRALSPRGRSSEA